jgi:hypothetical protein
VKSFDPDDNALVLSMSFDLPSHRQGPGYVSDFSQTMCDHNMRQVRTVYVALAACSLC